MYKEIQRANAQGVHVRPRNVLKFLDLGYGTIVSVIEMGGDRRAVVVSWDRGAKQTC